MIVFVTGASAGFGAAIARKFVQTGHRVVATARRQGRLEAPAGWVGGAVVAPAVGGRGPAAVEALPAVLPPEFAAVDVLVNNAGLALGLEPYEAVSRAKKFITYSLKGGFALNRWVGPGNPSAWRKSFN